MILSAVSLWKKFDMSNPLQPSEWGYEEDKEAGMRFWNVTYAGHKTEDGSVRVFAKFGKPASGEKFPAVLLLPDAGKELDQELLYYFIDKGYAVLMPDYSGETDGAPPRTRCIRNRSLMPITDNVRDSIPSKPRRTKPAGSNGSTSLSIPWNISNSGRIFRGSEWWASARAGRSRGKRCFLPTSDAASPSTRRGGVRTETSANSRITPRAI